MRWAIVINGVVVQVIAWDGKATYQPPAESTRVQHDRGNVGWTYVDGELVEPEPVPEPEPGEAP